MGLSEGTFWPKIAMVTIVVALLCHLISFGAAHWFQSNPTQTDRSFHYGLWRYCTYPVGGGEYCDDYINVITDDWLKVAQSFMTLSMFTLFGAVGATAAYAFAMQGESGGAKILMISIILSAISGSFVLIAVSTYGGKVWELLRDSPDGYGAGELGWAFGLAVISSIMSFISVILLVIEFVVGEVE